MLRLSELRGIIKIATIVSLEVMVVTLKEEVVVFWGWSRTLKDQHTNLPRPIDANFNSVIMRIRALLCGASRICANGLSADHS